MPIKEQKERNLQWYEMNTRKKNRLGYRKIALIFGMTEKNSWTTVRDAINKIKEQRGEIKK